MNIFLTVFLKFKDGNSGTAMGLLRDLVSASIAEEGCLQYELFQDGANENQFVIHETWVNQDALVSHTRKPPYIAFRVRTVDLLDGEAGIYQTVRLM